MRGNPDGSLSSPVRLRRRGCSLSEGLDFRRDSHRDAWRFRDKVMAGGTPANPAALGFIWRGAHPRGLFRRSGRRPAGLALPAATISTTVGGLRPEPSRAHRIRSIGRRARPRPGSWRTDAAASRSGRSAPRRRGRPPSSPAGRSVDKDSARQAQGAEASFRHHNRGTGGRGPTGRDFVPNAAEMRPRETPPKIPSLGKRAGASAEPTRR
jgi:hypothetical protein